LEKSFPLKEKSSRQSYEKPPQELIKPSIQRDVNTNERDEELRKRGEKLITTLQSFGVGAKIVGISKGPTVTRFEIQPNAGVKVSKIVSLADDIALNLAATGVRIEAPIPGKAAIGIEVPNKEVDIVYLHDVLSSSKYIKAPSKLSIALGMDISGNIIVGDIARMPHLLIAGSTGSGKSVCINSIILSILFKASPDEVKFIMIDQKVVELGVYNGIPHLLIPVVTNPKKAASAVAWAVNEVENRYAMFAQHNVRDLASYNKLASKKNLESGKLPQIVIIIDELADLMMVAANEIEDSIIRLAQKARAAGVHLVVATQRPSVNVITGLIKANIPSRIAFAVASQVDARTILDHAGAEKLLGRGDMLYHPIGASKPLRVQGAFVSDSDVEKVVEFVKSSYGPVEYDEEVASMIESTQNAETIVQSGNGENPDDELIEQACELAFEFNQLSASFLQRKLKIGYSRAARIIDTLEDRGLLSAADGSKPRQVLMSRREWYGS
jgi:S-DNA-T family DNA segregation ATPase FtsK/SpoIIIE